MNYRSQRGSRNISGGNRGKERREKVKLKKDKRRSTDKYLLKENEAPRFEEVVEKTLGKLNNLGGQTFAFSPFSQYFNDWLLSLKSVISEFESNSSIKVDEDFVKARSKLIDDIELRLSERRRDESVLENATRDLAKQSSLLVQTDTEYDYATQELVSRRKPEIKHLSRRLRTIEEEIENINQTQVSMFSPIARMAKSRKKADLTRKRDAVKDKLESTLKELEVEKEKLHDTYEEKKQAIKEKMQSLEKNISGSESDASLKDRRVVCEKLVNAIRALLKKKTLNQ